MLRTKKFTDVFAVRYLSAFKGFLDFVGNTTKGIIYFVDTFLSSFEREIGKVYINRVPEKIFHEKVNCRPSMNGKNRFSRDDRNNS